MWITSITPDGTVCLEIPPMTTSITRRIFIKAKMAPLGEGRIVSLGVNAPQSIIIVHEPNEEQMRHYPDQGVGVAKSLAEASEFEAEIQKKDKLAQDGRDEKAAKEAEKLAKKNKQDANTK